MGPCVMHGCRKRCWSGKGEGEAGEKTEQEHGGRREVARKKIDGALGCIPSIKRRDRRGLEREEERGKERE